MLLVDGALGAPVGLLVASANVAECKLLEKTIERRKTVKPKRIIADKAYDALDLFTRLAERGMQLIAPHKKNRVAEPFQDGRSLRRYSCRWMVERANAWLQNFRRVAVRYDRDVNRYIAFCTLACALIALRKIR
jgi:transposase